MHTLTAGSHAAHNRCLSAEPFGRQRCCKCRQRSFTSSASQRRGCQSFSVAAQGAVSASASTQPASGELPAELQKLVTTFSMVPDDKIKYQQLLYYGKKLPPMPQTEHTDSNKVRGCVSQVWVVAEVREGKVYWRADADSLLTKGLAALLVQGLSGVPPEDIVRVQPDFIARLGLNHSLTPSRNNGFLNIFKLMQAKSLQLMAQQAA